MIMMGRHAVRNGQNIHCVSTQETRDIQFTRIIVTLAQRIAPMIVMDMSHTFSYHRNGTCKG